MLHNIIAGKNRTTSVHPYTIHCTEHQFWLDFWSAGYVQKQRHWFSAQQSLSKKEYIICFDKGLTICFDFEPLGIIPISLYGGRGGFRSYFLCDLKNQNKVDYRGEKIIWECFSILNQKENFLINEERGGALKYPLTSLITIRGTSSTKKKSTLPQDGILPKFVYTKVL